MKTFSFFPLHGTGGRGWTCDVTLPPLCMRRVVSQLIKICYRVPFTFLSHKCILFGVLINSQKGTCYVSASLFFMVRLLNLNTGVKANTHNANFRRNLWYDDRSSENLIVSMVLSTVYSDFLSKKILMCRLYIFVVRQQNIQILDSQYINHTKVEKANTHYQNESMIWKNSSV